MAEGVKEPRGATISAKRTLIAQCINITKSPTEYIMYHSIQSTKPKRK